MPPRDTKGLLRSRTALSPDPGDSVVGNPVDVTGRRTVGEVHTRRARHPKVPGAGNGGDRSGEGGALGGASMMCVHANQPSAIAATWGAAASGGFQTFPVRNHTSWWNTSQLRTSMRVRSAAALTVAAVSGSSVSGTNANQPTPSGRHACAGHAAERRRVPRGSAIVGKSSTACIARTRVLGDHPTPSRRTQTTLRNPYR